MGANKGSEINKHAEIEPENNSSFYRKLANVKDEIGTISKDSTNPFYKSAYFDINQLLSHVEPLLHKNSLICLQPIEDGCVVTKIIDINTGESVTSTICLGEYTDPQKLGSAITYYRRYGLQSLLALQAEDDDGNKAKGEKPKEKPWLNAGSTEYQKAVDYLKKDGATIKEIEKTYKLSKEVKQKLTTL